VVQGGVLSRNTSTKGFNTLTITTPPLIQHQASTQSFRVPEPPPAPVIGAGI
jgi:hypothetical protein